MVSNGWEPRSRTVRGEHSNYYLVAFQYMYYLVAFQYMYYLVAFKDCSSNG